MWLIPGVRRILAYREPVDLRKSFPGLIGLVKAVLAEDPLSGSVFVFINRRGTLIKTIYWDRTGFCLFAKRLERGRFHLPGDGVRSWTPSVCSWYWTGLSLAAGSEGDRPAA